MRITETGIKGLLIISPDVFSDERGYFFESYNREKFRENGLDFDFCQDNESKSGKNVLRGLHFQVPPHAQGKLVRVILGAVIDVAVDLRKDSPTYGKHFSAELSASNKTMLWIPPGFAHGFATLQDENIFVYKCTDVYHKESERCIVWNDPDLNIDWKIKEPVVSEKDHAGMRFRDF